MVDDSRKHVNRPGKIRQTDVYWPAVQVRMRRNGARPHDAATRSPVSSVLPRQMGRHCTHATSAKGPNSVRIFFRAARAARDAATLFLASRLSRASNSAVGGCTSWQRPFRPPSTTTSLFLGLLCSCQLTLLLHSSPTIAFQSSPLRTGLVLAIRKPDQ